MGGVTFRGIRHRPGRSVVVLVLSMVAVAAAVLAPAYTQAARESMLADGLRAMPPGANTISVTAQGTGGSLAYQALDQSRDAVDASLTAYPLLDEVLGTPIGTVRTEGKSVRLHQTGEPLVQLTYRDGVCEHMTLAEGACPAAQGETMVSVRSAQYAGIKVGDRIELGSDRDTASFTVTGLYTPTDDRERYWGWSAAYFGHGVDDSGAMQLDAFFVNDDNDVRSIGGPTVPIGLSLDYPLVAGDIQLSEVDEIKVELADWKRRLSTSGRGLDTGLPTVLDDIAADSAAIGTSVPVVATPLVLLCLFVLFVVVANLTAERGPEVALAKLRGYGQGGVAYFGLAEALALILVSAPLGMLLGYGLVEATARAVLADGTHVRFVGGTVAYAAYALIGGALAAALGSWRTLSTPALELLRRVPTRRGWRVGLVDGIVGALALVALYLAYQARSSGSGTSQPLVLLGPPLLAVLVGVLAARLLILLARARMAAAGARGSVAGMLTWAQIARRPAMRQVIVLVCVATSLLSFAAIAWEVGEHNRSLAAQDALGARHVYNVVAPSPQAVLDAVNAVDPDGRFAMAAGRSLNRFGMDAVDVVAVQADRLAAVGLWRGHDRGDLAGVGEELRPGGPPPIEVKGPLTVTANVAEMSSKEPLRLVARVVIDGQEPKTFRLADLRPGEHTYTADLGDCAGGCRLVGLGVGRYPGTTSEVSAELTITGLADGTTDLTGRLAADQGWHRAGEMPTEVSMQATSVPQGLELKLRSSDPHDFVAEHGSVPVKVPVVHSGRVPADDPSATDFSFVGIHDQPQPFRVVGTAEVIPSGGRFALLADLETALRQATATTRVADVPTLRLQVWTNDDAPADFAERLSQHGVTVVNRDDLDTSVERLGRRAPALALRLYLLAGASAVVLAVGTVLLTTHSVASARGYEAAALRVAGVHRRVLRRSVTGEYTIVIGIPLLLGLLSGIAGAWLLLPTIPLVNAAGDAMPTEYVATGPWLPATLAATALGFAAAVAFAVRTLRRNGKAVRLREGDQ